jgi:hypothetical protein
MVWLLVQMGQIRQGDVPSVSSISQVFSPSLLPLIQFFSSLLPLRRELSQFSIFLVMFTIFTICIARTNPDTEIGGLFSLDHWDS